MAPCMQEADILSKTVCSLSLSSPPGRKLKKDRVEYPASPSGGGKVSSLVSPACVFELQHVKMLKWVSSAAQML